MAFVSSTSVPRDAHERVSQSLTETITHESPTKICSTGESAEENSSEISKDFLCSRMGGVRNLNTKGKLTCEQIFYTRIHNSRSKIRSGDRIKGFPTPRAPECSSALKRDVLSAANPRQSGELVYKQPQETVFSDKRLGRAADINIVQYLGIAADESERIKRHTKPGYALPLVEAGWDEAYCRAWCEERGMLSPIYTTAARGGCWFCHNQSVEQLRLLRRNYPDLWKILLTWDKDSPVSFKADGHTVHDFDLRFTAEDAGLIDPNIRFRWNMVPGVPDRKKTKE